MLTSIRSYFPLINRILKYVVSLVALFYVGYRIYTTNFTSQDIYNFLNPTTLFFVVLLTIINWVFEVLKWKVVVDTFSNISFKKAAYQTFVAYTYGMITPFNSGNYAKKIFFYPKKHSKRIVFLNLSKGLYQMLSTVIFGAWGVYILIDEIENKRLNQQQFVIITAIIGLIVCFIYRKKIIELTKSITLKVHFQLFWYSIIKFICFSLVLIFLLHQNHLPVLKLYAGICAVYLLSSLLPILNLLDFAIKGSVALWLFPPLGYSQQNILIAYFILWICNHAFPSLLGAILQFYSPKKEIL